MSVDRYLSQTNYAQTVPNQRLIKIHKTKVTQNFLQISKESLFRAYRDLGATGLVLYLYFAANKNEYVFALSPAAVNYETGMPLSTYRDQFRKLIERGYIVADKEHGNYLHFFESPFLNPEVKEKIESIEADKTHYVYQTSSAFCPGDYKF